MSECTIGKKVFNSNKRKALAFAHPEEGKKFKPGTDEESAGGFDFRTVLVGSTPDGRGTVYYDPGLGAGGKSVATQLLTWLPQIIDWHDKVFGYKGGQHNVIVAAVNGSTQGNGGAYHYGCDFSVGADLYCDVAMGDPALTAGLYAAELSEAYMGPNASLGQANPSPWGCGDSTGEGLSRRCADETVALIGKPGAMDAYSAAGSWDGTDWINHTDPTDQNYNSTGAAMCAIDWLVKAGYPLYKIAQAPAATLAQAYQALTGDAGSNFYPKLKAAVHGVAGGVQDDFPFTGGPDPAGAAGGSSPPPPPPVPGSLSLSVSPSSGAVPLSVSFSGTLADATTPALLDFGNGETYSVPTGALSFSYSYVYGSTGSYSAKLTQGDKAATASISVSASPPPPPPPGPVQYPNYSITLRRNGLGEFDGTATPMVSAETIESLTAGITAQLEARGLNPVVIADILALVRAIAANDLGAVVAAVQKLFTDLFGGGAKADTAAFNPALIGDFIALALAIVSKNPAAVAAALAKLLADLGR